jgi:hypothetical protein
MAHAASATASVVRKGAPAIFRLAPMSRDLAVMTWIALVLPAWLLGAAYLSAGPARPVLMVAVGLTLFIYAGVWLAGRPTQFEIDEESLRIVWPTRRRVIPRSTVRDARIVTGPEFRSAYGWGMRVGAGGLWGGFGILKTKATTFSLWISRTDRLVIVELDGANPLLVTPDDPERFVARLRA